MWLINLMLIIALATIIYVMCLALQQKQIGYLVILLAAFSVIGITVEAVMPTIDSVKQKAAKVQEFMDGIKKFSDSVDKITNFGRKGEDGNAGNKR